MYILGKYATQTVTTNDSALVNRHIALVGGSGGGKTAEAQYIIAQAASQGETVVALDWHGVLAPDQIFAPHKEAFEKYVNEVDAHGEGISIPLFTPVQYADGTMEDEVDTIGSLCGIFAATFGLGIRQEAELRKAAMFVYKKGSYATEGIAALDTALRLAGNASAESVRNKLYYITAHNVFRHGDRFLEPGKINIVRLSRFDLQTQQVIAEVLVNYLWRLGNADRFKEHPIILFIDECQNMPKGENGGLAHLLSEGRKLGINLVVATQMILQSTTSAVQQRISQAGLQLFFKPASSRVGMTARQIDASAESDWARTLRTLRAGEFIATGAFLVDGIEVDEPLKVSARIEDETQ